MVSKTVQHAFDFLSQALPDPLPAVLALVGPDRFLKRLALDRLSAASEPDGDLLTLAGSSTALARRVGRVVTDFAVWMRAASRRGLGGGRFRIGFSRPVGGVCRSTPSAPEF